MLKRLQISNYALISHAEVFFPGTLTVITGETGAGKSIFLDALGLALGRRADSAALAAKDRKCVVEAEFDISNLDLKKFVESLDLEYSDTVILRRELSADGRSRSLINDSAVSLSVMRELAQRLVDIHAQHNTLSLNTNAFQLMLLDSVGGSEQLASEYANTFSAYNSSVKELARLREEESRARKELDYYSFLYSELEDLKLAPGDLKKMEEESWSLENAGQIQSTLATIANGLSGDGGALSVIGQAQQHLKGLAKFGEKFAALSERLKAAYIEVKDLASEIESAGEDIIPDPKRLEELSDSIDRLNRLFRKHGVNDEQGLIDAKREISEKLSGFASLEVKIEATNREVEASRKSCDELAQRLTAARKKAVPAIEKKTVALLAELGMEKAVLTVELSRTDVFGSQGYDEVRLLFTANKGSMAQELSKVASGGELSRLMLALKSILAEKKKLPCIIFDEIDTGVSGEVADRVGNTLLKMSQRMQVIAITHLPQTASKGAHHLFVYKQDSGEHTMSHIRQLDESERVTEIAKMLSRGVPTQTAISNARELLAQ